MELGHATGAELRDHREAAGLTQEQVAAAAGVSRATLQNWESRARVVAPKAQAYLRAVRELAKPDGKSAA